MCGLWILLKKIIWTVVAHSYAKIKSSWCFQQIQIEEALVKVRDEKLDQLCLECDIKQEDLHSIVQPIIDSCTKDAILVSLGCWQLLRGGGPSLIGMRHQTGRSTFYCTAHHWLDAILVSLDDKLVLGMDRRGGRAFCIQGVIVSLGY